MPPNGVVPIKYTLTNGSAYSITGINATILGSGGTYTANSTDTTCSTTLDAGQTCNYVGTYMAGTTEGAGGMTASVAYAESPTPAAAANQTTNIVAATATVAVDPNLPSSLALNAKQKLTFTFKNTSPYPLTNVTGNVTSVTPMGSATYVPSGCNKVTLAFNETCVYTGDYSSSVAGMGQVDVTFTFTESPGSKTATSAVTTVQNKTVYVGTAGGGLWKSTDGGSTFTQIAGDTIGDGDVNTLFLSGNTIYAGASNGVFSSTDGMVFSKLYDLYTLSLMIFDSTFYIGTSNSGLYRVRGSSLSENSEEIGNRAKVYALMSGNQYFIGIPSGSFLDNGKFRRKTSGFTTYSFITYNSTAYAGTDVGLRTYPNPDVFNQCSALFSGNTCFNSRIDSIGDKNIFSLALSGLIMYAGTGANGLYRSPDGQNFSQIATDSIGNKTVRSLFVGSKVYAGTDSSGLYASTDGADGSTFTQLAETDLGSRTIYAILER
jgi:hypothetical protein